MLQSPAWAGDRPANAQDARERLLDATARCIQLYGLAKTGISDVAREAGVTRRTVYRYFDNPQALLGAALSRGVQDFVARAGALLASFDDPAEMIVEGVSFAMEELPKDPLLGRVLASGELILDEHNLPQALLILEPLTEPIATSAGWTPRERKECNEVLIRMALSLLSSPRRRDLRGFLQRRIVPALGLKGNSK